MPPPGAGGYQLGARRPNAAWSFPQSSHGRPGAPLRRPPRVVSGVPQFPAPHRCGRARDAGGAEPVRGLDRFLTEAADGAGRRFVSWANHGTCAKTMLTTLAVIEAEQLADRVIVVTRDGTALHDNESMAREAAGPPPTRPSLAGVPARGRPGRRPPSITTLLAQRYVRVHRDVPGEDERLAVVRRLRKAHSCSCYEL
ncbi:zeta toxin family protein [Streptomyces thinghirensis]